MKKIKVTTNVRPIIKNYVKNHKEISYASLIELGYGMERQKLPFIDRVKYLEYKMDFIEKKLKDIIRLLTISK